jgi:hypothetical protein
MTVLSLFPARIQFVNKDGTLTPEAWRALNELMKRVGGQSSENLDLDELQSLTLVDSVPGQEAEEIAETIVPTAEPEDWHHDISPTAENDEAVPEFAAPMPNSSAYLPAVSITPSGSPYVYTATNETDVVVRAGTVSKIEITRGSTAVDTGLTVGVFRLSPFDKLTVTYSSAPTMTGIPR